MWPRYIDYYVHQCKEENLDILDENKIVMSKEAEHMFMYTASQIKFWLQINEDGTTKVLKINDIDVTDKNIEI
jgi:hypothetical protein